MTERKLSKSEFVIRPAPGVAVSDVEGVLGEAASLEKLKSPRGGFVAKLESAPSNVREGWEALHSILGERAEVLPALVDERGKLSFPTGRLTVRFAKAATDDELASFAERYGLEQVRRTAFTRNQAVFAPQARGVFLPELCEGISHDDAVADAWLDAEAEYRRGAP